MLRKCFSLASAVSLAGSVVWISATAACGGSEDTPAGGSTSSSGDGGASSTSSSGSITSSTSSSGGIDGGGGGNPIVGKDPATVQGSTVPYGKCDAFTKCDGSLKGQWDVTGGCLPDSTFDEYKQLCAGLTVHDVTIKVKGTIGVDDTKVARDTSFFVNAQVDIDKANCAALAFAQGSCSSLAALLKAGSGGSKFDDAACNDSGDKCLCTAQVTIAEKTDDTYKTDGAGTLTTTGSAERTFDYCPKGSNTTYKETTPKNGTFGMFIAITKK